jgi:hypothetical protein
VSGAVAGGASQALQGGAPCRVQPTVRALRPRLQVHGLVLAAFGLALPGCAAQPPPEAEEPQIPSRAEVMESERREQPASPGAMAALRAYEQRVCGGSRAAGAAAAEEPRRGRSCRDCNNSSGEIETLEAMFKMDPGAPDAPRILERLAMVWAELGGDADRDCVQFRVTPGASVGEVEQAQRSLYALERIQQKARTEPARLCAQIRSQFPDYTASGACKPVAETPASPPSGDGWY